ncbi:M28 family peptidase [Tunturiibacter empetritectus]|uniref:M28 family peptidase n=1 Tax=Tunturiibacter empetritectus TaxID=3069691 RepID=UPI003D9AECED
MHLEQDVALRTIWDVTGTIDGTDPAQKEDWVVAGNHRDAWVYGAVDPNSGTAAMLETVHGLGELLKQGWKPQRRIVICSWDAEEEGLIGSTEWAEQHETHLAHAVAYFNTDVGVAGPNFDAAAVPSLKQFVREVTKEVASPKGGTVYEQWKADQATAPTRRSRKPIESTDSDVHIGTLGSGSDYTPSSSTSASPPPTSAPKAPTASITPSSTTTTGSPNSPTPPSSTSSSRPASSASRSSTWPTPTSSPTTTSSTAKRS